MRSAFKEVSQLISRCLAGMLSSGVHWFAVSNDRKIHGMYGVAIFMFADVCCRISVRIASPKRTSNTVNVPGCYARQSRHSSEVPK